MWAHLDGWTGDPLALMRGVGGDRVSMTCRFPVNKSRVRRVRPRPPTVSVHALGVRVSVR